MRLGDIKTLNGLKAASSNYVIKVDKVLYGTSLGFALKDLIALDLTGKFVKAKADALNTSNVIGMVVDEDLSFSTNGAWVIATGGRFSVNLKENIFNKGSTYYLSDTVAGGFTDTAPTALGSIVKPVFVAADFNTAFSNNGIMLNLIGIENTAPKSAQVSITNADLSSGNYVLNHNLAQQFVRVEIFDNALSNRAIPSGAISFTDGNKLTINMSTVADGALTGTWTIRASK